MRNTRTRYENSKIKLNKGTVIGHFRQLLDMDVTVIGHLLRVPPQGVLNYVL